MMTERAQQIVDQKPTGWEYKLTAELLEAELRPIRTRFEDIDRGVAFAPTKTVDGLEFMQFVQEQSRKLQVMLQQPELILQNELMPAWDRPASPAMLLRSSVQLQDSPIPARSCTGGSTTDKR